MWHSRGRNKKPRDVLGQIDSGAGLRPRIVRDVNLAS
jgi:hypothetical protein